jgi:hypothetical protein
MPATVLLDNLASHKDVVPSQCRGEHLLHVGAEARCADYRRADYRCAADVEYRWLGVSRLPMGFAAAMRQHKTRTAQ